MLFDMLDEIESAIDGLEEVVWALDSPGASPQSPVPANNTQTHRLRPRLSTKTPLEHVVFVYFIDPGGLPSVTDLAIGRKAAGFGGYSRFSR
jgi:hypothetical protein